MSEEDLDLSDGRIDLPLPTREDLEKAAEEILGEAPECFLGDDGTQIVRGMGRLWIKIPPEETAMMLDEADRGHQEAIIWAAAKVRAERIREESMRFLDPKTNPLIKGD